MFLGRLRGGGVDDVDELGLHEQKGEEQSLVTVKRRPRDEDSTTATFCFYLQGSSSDKESVDVGLRGQLVGACASHRTCNT
jgi:hypothetical protein